MLLITSSGEDQRYEEGLRSFKIFCNIIDLCQQEFAELALRSYLPKHLSFIMQFSGHSHQTNLIFDSSEESFKTEFLLGDFISY